MNDEIDELETRASSLPMSLYPGESVSRELI